MRIPLHLLQASQVAASTPGPAAATDLASRSVSNATVNGFAALDWSIPEKWDKPTGVPTSYGSLQRTAQDAINGMKSYWPDPNIIGLSWDVGTTLGAFAYKDMVASTKDNSDYIKKALQHVKSKNANFDPYSYNDDAQWWGTTSFYAYRAYGDKQFLDWAKDVWEWVATSQITQQQADAGKHPLRAAAIKGKCNNKSVAGGVFWRAQSSDRKDMDVNVITTSLFETLSAYLAEATGEKKYLDAAMAAYKFITTQMMQAKPNIPIDTLKMADCGTNKWILTYNTGKFIEGTTVLLKLLPESKERDAMKAQLLQTIHDAVTATPNWQGEKGHITEGQKGDPKKGGTDRQFKSIYLRALTETYRRFYNVPEVRKLLKTYVSIQYQSITTKARNGNKYGLVWQGPFVDSLSGQANALDALVAGLEMNWAR